MEGGDGVGGVVDFLDGEGEYGVWAGFDEGGTGEDELFDGGVELDGVAEILVPVVGGEVSTG